MSTSINLFEDLDFSFSPFVWLEWMDYRRGIHDILPYFYNIILDKKNNAIAVREK